MPQSIWKKISGVYGTWFILLLLLNLSQISSYYHTTINKFILAFCVMGLLQCKRHKVFCRENRRFTIPTTIITLAVAIYFVTTNTFYIYLYYNYTIGCALIIYANLYVGMIKKFVDAKRKIHIGFLGGTVLVIFACVACSVNATKLETLGVLFFVFPMLLEQYTKEDKIQAIQGMIDGTCCAFLLGQIYAFGFQHYMYDRYTGYFLNTTYAGLMYMYIYVALLSKYVILKIEHRKYASVFWLLSVFVLSLLYLTGGRSPVLGVMLATAIILFVLQWFQPKRVSITKWLLQCLVIGVVSVMLFPISYTAVRYLPTIINKPDYTDSTGTRYYSPMRLLFNEYQYDGQYQYDPITYEVYAVEYVEFYESLYYTLGRIVPGGTDILDVIYDANGIEVYKIQDDSTITISDRTMFSSDEENDIMELVSASSYETNYLPKIATPIVSLAIESGRGTDASNPWFAADYDVSSFEIRSSIHRYTISKLNWFGHESSALGFYMIEDQQPQPHPHNIFLMYGYNFGIPAMIFLAVMMLGLLYQCGKSVFKDKQGHSVYLLCIVATTIMFGMFEYTMGPTQYIAYFMYFIPFLIPSGESL